MDAVFYTELRLLGFRWSRTREAFAVFWWLEKQGLAVKFLLWLSSTNPPRDIATAVLGFVEEEAVEMSQNLREHFAHVVLNPRCACKGCLGFAVWENDPVVWPL